MKILVVEDDVKLAELIKRGLSQAGHVVDTQHDGDAGEQAAAMGTYEVIVLDLMLPRKHGIEVLRALRSRDCHTPIIVLTARDETEDVVAGFDAGADDYLRKPFAFDELSARIRTLARRAIVPPRLVLRAGNLTFDTVSRRAFRGDRELFLTSRELAYLEYFLRNAGRTITRGMLENALWSIDSEVSSNVIDVYVKRLRAKIEFDDMPQLITTIRGIGYRLD